MNDSIHRQPSHVPAKSAQHYAKSLDAGTSFEDITTSPKDAVSAPDVGE